MSKDVQVQVLSPAQACDQGKRCFSWSCRVRRFRQLFADHVGDRQKIERIDELLDARTLNAVADAMIETPEYLKDLIGDYRSAKHKGRWIDAATKVETYRHRHGITDPGSAFGAESPGVERLARSRAERPSWMLATFAVNSLVLPTFECCLLRRPAGN